MNFWLKAAVAATVLPLVAWPSLLARAPHNILVWLYPAVVALYAWLAIASRRERPALAWILVAMSSLTSLAIWLL